jgi:hypothetical protein
LVPINTFLAACIFIFHTPIDNTGFVFRDEGEWDTARYDNGVDVVAAWKLFLAVAREVQVVAFQAGAAEVLGIVGGAVFVVGDALLVSENVVFLAGGAFVIP